MSKDAEVETLQRRNRKMTATMHSTKIEKVEDALALWDAGESVFTIEMGGLGPGYEQAIQVLVWEIVRDYIGKDIPDFTAMALVVGQNAANDEWWKFGDEAARRCDLGFSGAQVGAARGLAYKYLKDGYRATLDSLPRKMDDRKIQVSRVWPQPPAAPIGDTRNEL